VTLNVRVIPRSARSAIAGRRGEAILVRLSAPPVDGAANEALVELLARTFDRPRRNVTIVAGARSRDKRVNIEGLSETAGWARLTEIIGPSADDAR
jgi:uncharacterized protein (TIGR00251 family)